MKILGLVVVLSSCLNGSSTDCGSMPEPQPMLAREVDESHVMIETQRWFAHQAWSGAMIAWGHCMAGD